MSDPVPAITESAASGEIAEIFADIRQVYRVGVVNLIWRHLATFPQALPWVWQSVRPLYVDGTIEREAAVLRASIAVPEFPAFPAAVIAAAGLGEHDLNQIRTILAAYDRTNAMALIALSAVGCKIAGMPVDGEGDGAIASGSELPFAPPPELRLPPLLSLSELLPATAELVLTMNRIGAKRDDAIVASMYRHLAHWPAYLALAWTMLAPLAGTRLDGLIAHAIAQARAPARRMIGRLPPPSTLAPAVRADVARALDRFAGDVIPKMVVIGALLRRTTTAKSNAE